MLPLTILAKDPSGRTYAITGMPDVRTSRYDGRYHDSVEWNPDSWTVDGRPATATDVKVLLKVCGRRLRDYDAEAIAAAKTADREDAIDRAGDGAGRWV